MNNPQEAWRFAREAAFRRGYQQGANAAFDLVLDALHAGVSLKDVTGMAAMYSDELMDWRSNTEDILAFPPSTNQERIMALWRAYQDRQKEQE